MRFIDRYFYNPSPAQKCLIFLLLPISFLYLLCASVRGFVARFYDFGLPIVSVGNLIVGGSGKTPFVIEIANGVSGAFIIMRGFKRKSRGLVVVSLAGEILVSEEEAGDEAYLIAKSLKNANVIVCKDRVKAILYAKSLGAKCVFLDDGFRFNFKKLNIILEPKLKPYFLFTLPSGMYRELPSAKKKADLLLQEGEDYKRIVSVENPTERMILLTAIANPARLDEFLPNVIEKIYLPDHSTFDYKVLHKIFIQRSATSFLVTSKDAVKLERLNLKLSFLALRLDIKPEIKQRILDYINGSTDEIDVRVDANRSKR